MEPAFHAPEAAAASARALAPGVAVKARGVRKAYGGKVVLDALDMDIPAGQFVAVVGRSGCGKSTLLRMIAGLETVDAGIITLGHDGANPRDCARMMFQEPRLLPWANVLANVAVGAAEDSDLRSARRADLDALKRVGLARRAADWPSALSGGEKQRVALARALLSKPRLLALDEPLGALDALTRIEMQRLVEEVWQRTRFTAVLVTHDVAEAVALADRILLIEHGVVAMDVAVDLPRPRRRGWPEAASLEDAILSRLLR